MLDQIYLRDYTIIAKHGYYKEGHTKPQRFIVSITVTMDGETGKNDDLRETLNYEKLRQIATEVLMQSPRDLIESLAEEVAQKVLVLSRVASVEVIIEKPDVWFDSTPGVKIIRTN